MKQPKEQSESDPEFINVGGAPCVFQKRVKHNLGKRSNKDHNLTATAFRNGHSSSVALLLTSNCEDESLIDFVIDTAKNVKNYFCKNTSRAAEIMRGFDFLVGEKDVDGHAEKLGDVVLPLTQTQGDKTWWLMRSFSCVSSVMDRVIRAKAPNIDNNHRRRDDYDFVAMYANFTKLLPGSVGNEEGSDMSVDSVNSDQRSNNSEDHTISDETVLGLLQDDAEDEDGNRPEGDWDRYMLPGQ